MQSILDLKAAGIDRMYQKIFVRFPMRSDRQKDAGQLRRYAPETIVQRCKKSLEECRKNGVELALLAAPQLPLQANKDTAAGLLETSVKECLRLCGAIQCSFLLVEAPFDRQETEKNRAYLLRCARAAEEQNVMLLLKNQTRDVGGHLTRGFCAEAAEAAQWVDALNHEMGYEAFGFCADIGVCSLCGNQMQSFLREVGAQRMKAVILRDCDGVHDTALLPFTCANGGTDWLSVFRGLRDIGFDGELVLDFSDTNAAFSPLLRPYLYPLVRQTLRYFQWQIEIENHLRKYKKIVLFGAGNMCRNYMKCYGEKYPPLFTCDNNPKRWGTTFEGLTVHDPKDLTGLPADCAVIICNVYYREIEAQLSALGVKNIGYFNDEYMPSFYFDRLEQEE